MDKFFIGCFIVFLFIFSCKKEEKSLPKIYIDSSDTIRYDSFKPVGFLFDDQKETLSFTGKVKYRGGYSSQFNKKSYALKTDTKVRLASLPIEDDWVLNASYIDKTFLRHKLGYELFMEMSPHNLAPLSTYIEVYENKEYQGLYILNQKLTAHVLGVNKKDSSALLFKEPPIFYKDEMYYQDTVNLFQQKYPKLKYKDESSILLEFRDFLFNTNDLDFYQNINQWIDVENVVDWYLLVLFSNAGDNIVKNFYLYKMDANTPFRIALWDFDHSFGRDGDNEKNIMFTKANLSRSILFTRLRNNPYFDFNNKLEKRWKELRRNGVFTFKHIHAKITDSQNQLKSAIKKNEIRWPYSSENYFDDNSYEQEIRLIEDFVQMRLKDLDNDFCNQ